MLMYTRMQHCIDHLIQQFFEEFPEIKEDLTECSKSINDAYSKKDANEAKSSLTRLKGEHDHTMFCTKFDEWVNIKPQNVTVKALVNYRFKIILMFIEATRTSNLNLHLRSGEQLGKIFFGMVRLKYLRLWPRYIADMK